MLSERANLESSSRSVIDPFDTPFSKPTRKLWGTISREERWGLSGKGWIVAFVLLVTAAILLLVTIHPFLVVTHRVDAKILVVEGWIHEYAIRVGAEEFRNGDYEKVYTTGGPVSGSGGYTWDADTSANVGAGGLRKCGINSEQVQMVPSHFIGRDRTYNSAVALRDWFREQRMAVDSINVVTENTHARRTRLLFQKAFGDKVRVGIIAAANPDYEPKRWWRSSDGFREVISESIAYIYAKFFFHPTVNSHYEL